MRSIKEMLADIEPDEGDELPSTYTPPVRRPKPSLVAASSPEPEPVPADVTRSREQWLDAFTTAARPIFAAAGAPLPVNIRNSIGFMYGTRKAIGQCWSQVASSDGAFEIFVSPVLSSVLDIADTLTHELCHAADGCAHGHGAPFKRIALAVGLVGKMTSAGRGPLWHVWADPILAELGEWPGAAMDPGPGRKKQTTRMLKCVCRECELIFRMSGSSARGKTLRCPDDECDGFVDVASESGA